MLIAIQAYLGIYASMHGLKLPAVAQHEAPHRFARGDGLLELGIGDAAVERASVMMGRWRLSLP